MTTNAEAAFEQLKTQEGVPDEPSDWFVITQDVINAFADVTLDHQFIHVDPEKAAELSPWKVTVAHGFLTLSMLVHLATTLRPQNPQNLDGLVMGVNYGFDKVRFISPVKVDSRIRAASTLKLVEQKDPTTLQVTRAMTVEIEGEPKPALVADWLSRMIFS